MATPEQIAANRQNALKSTGPVTEAGKQTSARNATTHGMTSSALIIPGESLDQFNALKADLLGRLKPVGELENELAEAVILAQWRHRRMLRFEAAFWQYETETYTKQCAEAGTECDPAMAAARLFSDPACHRKLSLLLRYLNSAQKDYAKALDTFNAAQQHRLENEPEEDEPVKGEPTTQQIGFVSQRPQSTQKHEERANDRRGLQQSSPAPKVDLLRSNEAA